MKALKVEAVPHGFRSSFRSWCADTGVDRELAEACLAHAVGNQVEQAYKRTAHGGAAPPGHGGVGGVRRGGDGIGGGEGVRAGIARDPSARGASTRRRRTVRKARGSGATAVQARVCSGRTALSAR